MPGRLWCAVVFLSGDDLVCADARESIPGVYTVETKIAISNNAALCHHPLRNAQRITETVKAALLHAQSAGAQPMVLEGETCIDVRYSAEVQAARAAAAPNARRLDETSVRCFAPDYLTAYQAFLIGASLAGNFRDDADLYRCPAVFLQGEALAALPQGPFWDLPKKERVTSLVLIIP